MKANAYGHGLLEAAHTLQDADCYGVARIGEALMLRSGGIVKPILLLEGFFSAEDLPVLVANNIETAVHSIEQLEALELAELARPVPVWMKLDTGIIGWGAPRTGGGVLSAPVRLPQRGAAGQYHESLQPRRRAGVRRHPETNRLLRAVRARQTGPALGRRVRRHAAVAGCPQRVGASRHHFVRRVAAG